VATKTGLVTSLIARPVRTLQAHTCHRPRNARVVQLADHVQFACRRHSTQTFKLDWMEQFEHRSLKGTSGEGETVTDAWRRH
jgi:hypothetical protein